MNESTKTLSFVLAAALALGAAWIGRPKPVGVDLPDLVGQELFPKFKDAYDAKSMEIVKYDEELGELRTFEVAQKNGLWVIPSHQDYPADAEETLAEAANMLVGLKVINVQSDEKKEHATYGVVRPNVETLKAGDKGVGQLVTFKDAKGSRLAEVVIGEPVTGQPGQRYVRAADQEPVYIVELDPSKLSTKFEDWVQRDVLDLNGFDVRDISIYDYSANPQLTNRGLVLSEKDRLKITTRWEPDEARWVLDEFKEFVGDELRPSELLETEELNKESLDAMKRALDDLKIVDVERKPEGLGAKIVDDRFWDNREGIQSLFERGFYPAQDADGNPKLRSSDGEVTVRTTDGIEYTLRFGQVAGIESDTNATESSTDVTGLNRFVMVNAAVYKDAFDKPELELEDAQADDTDTPESENTDEESDQEPADQEEASVDDAVDDDSQADADEAASADGDASEEAMDAEREAKIKDYERQMDEYKDKLKKAQEKVDKLNFRFADWYYVVPEDEYRKIHLGRSDIIRGKESTVDDGYDVEAFRALQEADLDATDAEGL